MFKEILRKNRGLMIFALLALIPLIASFVFETGAIQSFGIVALRAIRTVSFILAGAGVASLAAGITVSTAKAIGENRQKELTAQKLEELKAQKELQEKNERAKLNIREPLEDSVIYERLKSWLGEDWGRLGEAGIPDCICDILRQMDEMNSYQAKLSRLIANNGADYLEDTIGVLDSVEQCILRKVRKILNCFVIYESTRAEDVEKMRMLLFETRSGNAAQLQNVKEFLFAITDFLNKQGDDNTGIEKLDIYKTTILESTDDAE